MNEMSVITRKKVKELLLAAPGQEVLAKGWVRTKRGNKQIKFIALNDVLSPKSQPEPASP